MSKVMDAIHAAAANNAVNEKTKEVFEDLKIAIKVIEDQYQWIEGAEYMAGCGSSIPALKRAVEILKGL